MYLSKKIAFTSFWLSVFVVIIHCVNVHLYSDINYITVFIQNFLTTTFNDTVVPLFFVISGYLFWKGIPVFFEEFIDIYVEKIKRRVHSLIIPYFMWNIIYYFMFSVLLSLPFASKIMTTIPTDFSLNELVLAVFFHKYNGVYWYVYHIILFAFFSPVIFSFVKRKKGLLWCLILVLLGNYYKIYPDTVWGIHVDMLAYWMIGGWCACNKVKQWEQRSSKKEAVICGSLFCILSLINYILMPYAGNIVIKIFLSYLIVCNVYVLWHFFDYYEIGYEREYMKNSFWIYSAHPLLVDGIKKILVILLPNNSLSAMLNYIICIVLSVYGLIIIGDFMSEKMPLLWRALTGGRGKKV